MARLDESAVIEFYPTIKQVHIASVFASFGLFALRGAALLAGARWPRVLPVRALSWTIDSVLLTAAMMLLVILPSAMFANRWLSAKLVALVVYVGLGHRALAAATPLRRRPLWLAAALVCFGYMVSVARTHHPLGLASGWLA
jgi:uncharacterized membrane protein SirB2